MLTVCTASAYASTAGSVHVAEARNEAWTGAGMERGIGVNFADIFGESEMHRHNEELIEAEARPKEGAQPLSFHKQYARTTTVQVRAMSCVAASTACASAEREWIF